MPRDGVAGPPWTVSFDPRLGDCPTCGPRACKGGVLRRLRRPGDTVAVFGDGISDLCLAREADVVFARGRLAELCEREGIAYHRLSDYRLGPRATDRADDAPRGDVVTTPTSPRAARPPPRATRVRRRPAAAPARPRPRRPRASLWQFVRFCLVGGSGVIVNLAVFTLVLLVWLRSPATSARSAA